MKTPSDTYSCPSASVQVPTGFCRKVADALVTLKEQLLVKYENALPGRRQLIRSVIAEAEALAWETSFPHLLLPDFAEARLAEALAVRQSAYAHAA